METTAFITIPDAGRRLFGVSRAQSYALANRGLLPVVRIGRRALVPTAALDRLISEISNGAGEVAANNWRLGGRGDA